MAGRNRLLRHADGHRGFRNGPRPVINRGPGTLPLHPAALEEELEVRHREIQRIIAENHHMIDENTILQRELAGAREEIHRLGQVIPKIRADKEAHARELIDRGMKLESKLRATEPLKAEVMQLRAELQKLNASRQDLSSQVKGLTQDINRLQAENQQLISMRADFDGLQKELMEARRAFDFEKKANEEQLGQKEAMEKNLVSMAREIEKLQAEQLNADMRLRGHGGGSYGMMSRSPEMRYPSGGSYGGSWGLYDARGHRR